MVSTLLRLTILWQFQICIGIVLITKCRWSWSIGGLFPRFHGDSWHPSLRLRSPLRVRYFQAAHPRRMAGLSFLVSIFSVNLIKFRSKSRMTGFDSGIPGKRRARSTCFRLTFTEKWSRIRMANRNGWIRKSYLPCRMILRCPGTVTMSWTRFGIVKITVFLVNSLILGCGLPKPRTISTWSSSTMETMCKRLWIGISRKISREYCTRMIMWVWIYEGKKTLHFKCMK